MRLCGRRGRLVAYWPAKQTAGTCCRFRRTAKENLALERLYHNRLGPRVGPETAESGYADERT